MSQEDRVPQWMMRQQPEMGETRNGQACQGQGRGWVLFRGGGAGSQPCQMLKILRVINRYIATEFGYCEVTFDLVIQISAKWVG